MRVLVCGGADYKNAEAVFRALDRLHQKRGITTIIQGAADGADRWAVEWAFERGVGCASFPARWDLHGRAAGMVRNKRMIKEGRPDGVVAFPGGKGTEGMIALAELAGLTVWRPEG